MITPNAIWDVTEEPTDAGPVVLIDVPAGADLPYVFRTLFLSVSAPRPAKPRAARLANLSSGAISRERAGNGSHPGGSPQGFG